MKQSNYSEKLKHPKWQKKRLEIMQRDEFRCKLCKDTETTLNVHHLEYSENPWDVENDKLITVCEHCHSEIEDLKKIFDDFDINEFNILKDTWPEKNQRMIIFRYKYTLMFRIYHDNVVQSSGIERKNMIKLQELLLESINWKNGRLDKNT